MLSSRNGLPETVALFEIRTALHRPVAGLLSMPFFTSKPIGSTDLADRATTRPHAQYQRAGGYRQLRRDAATGLPRRWLRFDAAGAYPFWCAQKNILAARLHFQSQALFCQVSWQRLVRKQVMVGIL